MFARWFRCRLFDMKRKHRGPAPEPRPPPPASTRDAGVQTDPLPPAWLEGPLSAFAGRLAWDVLIPLFLAMSSFPGLGAMVEAVSRKVRPLNEGDTVRDAMVWDGVRALRLLSAAVAAPPAPKPLPTNHLDPTLESLADGEALDDLG